MEPNKPCEHLNITEQTELDCDICSSCKEHSSVEVCDDCGEELGTVCCGAGTL